jgi:hypothetical protein
LNPAVIGYLLLLLRHKASLSRSAEVVVFY